MFQCSCVYSEKLDSFGGNVSEEALVLYPSSAPCPTPVRCPERSFTTMVSDLRATCPNNHLASRAAGGPQIQAPPPPGLHRSLRGPQIQAPPPLRGRAHASAPRINLKGISLVLKIQNN